MAFNLAVLQVLELPDGGIERLWSEAYPAPTLPDFAAYREEAMVSVSAHGLQP